MSRIFCLYICHMKQEKIDKRAAALRENLKKRKALATQTKQEASKDAKSENRK